MILVLVCAFQNYSLIRITLIKFLEEIKDNHSEVEVENNNDVNNNNEVDNNMILKLGNPDNNKSEEHDSKSIQKERDQYLQFIIKKHKKSSLTLYKEAADYFIVDAQFRYACVLIDKDIRLELKIDKKEIIKRNGYLKEIYGYKKNLEMAILWYKRAALQNNEGAREKLRELEVEFHTCN
ncbi:hypothetical protein RhiirA5_438711 [Rhizophagus irregularis]|uniref:Uncharacterized protein n=1 Tax=Rhizophagus irregularis TaxID=588596 RepID=A0A2I1EQG8_9GLOM|nr:hypothetical protein RhiirA5_438711 [Rhizophagus irregularis]PKY24354.1 hypothetical protein RhiirB3_438876 [Rhizophagus irregularis]